MTCLLFKVLGADIHANVGCAGLSCGFRKLKITIRAIHHASQLTNISCSNPILRTLRTLV